MRLILHVGMAKTGTSTLQQALNSNSRLLARSGVLYPKPRFGKANHNYLTGLVLPMERMPREYTSAGADYDTIHRQATSFWEDVKRQAKGSGAGVMILSGEYVYGLGMPTLEAFADLLGELTEDIQVVCYVRHPADYYVSLTQQIVKASAEIRAPGEFRMRARTLLPAFVELFDGNVTVRPYDRTALRDGDIVTDFATEFLPGGAALARSMVVEDRNESMSAEATCILQALRRNVWPDRGGQFLPESTYIANRLRALWEGSNQHAARLRPELRAAMIRRHLPDLRYLEDQFGVVFDREGADAEPSDTAAPPPGWMSHDLTEILDVDDGCIEHTIYELVRELAVRKRPALRSPISRR